MPAQVLRDYQQRALTSVLDAYKNGARSVLMVLPTAGGKTTTFATLMAQVPSALLLVHRRELATQAANRLREFGSDFGFIMAGEPSKPYAKIQIASVQTLIKRRVPKASLVVCDEAHLSTAKTWQGIISQYPKARILGVTATPWRLSGKPLVGAYDACVVAATPSELREQGHLCGYTGFSYLAPDLSKVKTTGGDYNERQSSEAMRAPQVVDNIVEQWLKHASTLSTVVFAVTVEHSLELTAKFRAAGVAAEHLDGKTSAENRKAILRRVESGQTRVLSNVGVAVEGLDIPRLKCCVLARPTKSLARAIQMMGRVRRPWEGQAARIHDHAFNLKLHGLPDDDRDYSLSAKPEELSNLTQCQECLAMYRGPRCTACAHENEPVALGERELVTVADAEMFEFGSEGGPAVSRPPVEVRWDSIGKVIEGVFSHAWDADTSFGKQRRYLVKGEKRDYNFPGTTVLNRLMGRVVKGDKIRVTHTGETLLTAGRAARKEFRVEKDDGKGAPSGMGLREYARHRGCHFSAVQQAIKGGRLPKSVTTDENGRTVSINPEIADQEWADNTMHTRRPGTNNDYSVACKHAGCGSKIDILSAGLCLTHYNREYARSRRTSAAPA